MCRWVSIIPGITMPPLASISSAPSGAWRRGPTAAIRSAVTSTSASVRMVWASSMVSTVPPRSTAGRPTSVTVEHRRSGCQAILLPTSTLTGYFTGLGWSVNRPWTIVRMTDSVMKGRQRDDGGPGRGAAGRAASGGLLPDPGRPVRDHAAGRHGGRGGQGRGAGRGRYPYLAAPGPGRRLDLLPRRQPQQALDRAGPARRR